MIKKLIIITCELVKPYIKAYVVKKLLKILI